MSANNNAANNPKIFKTPFQLARLLGNRCGVNGRKMRQQKDKNRETGRQEQPCYSMNIPRQLSTKILIEIGKNGDGIIGMPKKPQTYHREVRGRWAFLIKLDLWNKKSNRPEYLRRINVFLGA